MNMNIRHEILVLCTKYAVSAEGCPVRDKILVENNRRYHTECPVRDIIMAKNCVPNGTLKNVLAYVFYQYVVPNGTLFQKKSNLDSHYS